MLRVTLNLEDPRDLQQAQGRWKFAQGLVPGEPNEGLEARLTASPARLADYADSDWEVCEDLQVGRSRGFHLWLVPHHGDGPGAGTGRGRKELRYVLRDVHRRLR